MQETELIVNRVPRALEMKSKLFGFELPDLLIIFLNLGITNLIFGSTSLRYLLVWGTTILLALFLYLVKRGKPDSYLQHLIESWIRPSYFAAGGYDQKYKKFKGELQNVKKEN